MKKQQICILGSTGSIGTQALDVIEQHSDLYEVYCLTANNRVQELAEQARKFHPAAVVIANEARYEELKDMLSDEPDIKVYAGAQALCDIVQAEPIDMVLASMVGFSGLEPTIHAIKARKKICLANKETLVVAGELICNLAQECHVPILPVDSEHSAIFQSLVGEGDNEVEKILLTCSGGPFRNYTHEQLEKVTAARNAEQQGLPGDQERSSQQIAPLYSPQRRGLRLDSQPIQSADSIAATVDVIAKKNIVVLRIYFLKIFLQRLITAMNITDMNYLFIGR